MGSQSARGKTDLELSQILGSSRIIIIWVQEVSYVWNLLMKLNILFIFVYNEQGIVYYNNFQCFTIN